MTPPLNSPKACFEPRFGGGCTNLCLLPWLLMALWSSGHAAVKTWDGSSSGNWSVGANWSGNVAPVNGDDLVFPSGAANLVNTNNSQVTSLRSITFTGSGYTLRGTGPVAITGELNAHHTSGDNLIEFAVNVNKVQTFECTNTIARLKMSGAIGGSGGVTKTGAGVLTYLGSSANTYSGPTTVNEGILELDKSSFNVSVAGSALTVGDRSGAAGSAVLRNLRTSQIPSTVPITINSDGTWDLNNVAETIGTDLTLSRGSIDTGGASGQIALGANATVMVEGSASILGDGQLNVGSGTCSLVCPASLDVYATILGSATILKSGGSSLRLRNANTYSGPMVVSEGYVWAYDSRSLGTTAGGTVVSNGASLVLSGSFGITNETLTLNGPGVSTRYGALDAEANPGTNIWAGTITVNADSTIAPYGSNTTLRIIGAISGDGGVQLSGSGQLYFEGTNANTYAGSTVLPAGNGILLLNKSVNDVAVPSSLVVTGRVRLLQDLQIANSADVFLAEGGVLELNSQGEGIDTLRGAGRVDLGDGGGIGIGLFGGTSQFDGLLSGLSGGIGKSGGGTFTWNGGNLCPSSHANAMQGDLILNGYQPQCYVHVYVGGTLGGTGTVGRILNEGTLAPGPGPGLLTCSNLQFYSYNPYVPSSVLAVDLNGPVAGVDYDQVRVQTASNLYHAKLFLTANFLKPVTNGQEFVFIRNDGTNPIGSSFASAEVTMPSGYLLQYSAGDGNDLGVKLKALPVACSATNLTAGNGDAVISPNECLGLTFVITNNSSVSITGISATLSCPDPNVLITRAQASYPDVPASGRSTNTTAFKLSTLPSFSCGRDINLTLAVTTSSHGTMSIPILLRSGVPRASPLRYDNNTATNIPDPGTIESTNVVNGFNDSLRKVTVALWLTHTYDADLIIKLISPDGVQAELSYYRGASGDNFGTNCAPDSARTTFDDDAAVGIWNSAAPFVGMFRPEQSLDRFIGGSANGDWRLRITDSYGSDAGVLQCWSLFLHGPDCAPGGGACALCPTVLTNTPGTNGTTQAGRLALNCVASSCGATKPCPGLADAVPRYYQAYTFYNGRSNACITVTLANTSCAMMSAAYLGSFDPTNLCSHYLGDTGTDTLDGQACGAGPGARSYSFNVPADSMFVVTVNEVGTSLCGSPYTLSVSGGDCRPLLAIQPVASPNVNVNWPTVAGAYQLESSPAVSPPSWNPVTNTPIAVNNRFTVTNTTLSSSNRFYRLHMSQ